MRRKKEHQEISRMCVRTVIKCLQGLRKAVSKLPSGSNNKESAWCIKRRNFCLQLLLQFQTISWNEISHNPPPEYFDIQQLGTLDLTQIIWFDETHPKFKLGYSFKKR